MVLNMIFRTIKWQKNKIYFFEKRRTKMIKDQETRKWLGIVFVLIDDYVSSLDDVEFKELEPIFYQLILDVLTREDGPYPVGSEKRRKV